MGAISDKIKKVSKKKNNTSVSNTNDGANKETYHLLHLGKQNYISDIKKNQSF